MSNKFVWENSLGFGMGSNIRENETKFVFNLAKPTAYIKSELRYIYNIEKRIAKQKSIHNNSGNYMGLQTKYSGGKANEPNLNQTLLTEIHWGMQRSLGEKFIFNAHVGLGYLKDFDSKESNMTPTVGVRFGYKSF